MLAFLSLFQALHIWTIKMAFIGFMAAGFSFVASAATYLSLSLFKLLSVKWPFYYRRFVSGKLTMWILIATWIIAIALTMGELVILLSYFGELSLFNCNSLDCLKFIEIMVAGTSLAIYILVVGAFFYTFLIVREAKKNSPRSHNHHQSEKKCNPGICMIRLGSNVLTYMVMCSMEAPATWLIISMAPIAKIEHTDSRCAFDSMEIDQWHSTIVWAVVCCSIFLSRLILDPILNCAMDNKLRLIIVSWIKRSPIHKLRRMTTMRTMASSVSSLTQAHLNKNGSADGKSPQK